VAAQYRFDTSISSILHFVFFWKEEVDEKPFLLTFVPKKTHNSSQFRMDPILTPQKKPNHRCRRKAGTTGGLHRGWRSDHQTTPFGQRFWPCGGLGGAQGLVKKEIEF